MPVESRDLPLALACFSVAEEVGGASHLAGLLYPPLMFQIHSLTKYDVI